jgi:hypothetical protein
MEEQKEERFTFFTFAPGYSNYFQILRDNGYDDEALRLMTESDMGEMFNLLKLLPMEKIKFKAGI